jgi:hypothetical protein
MRDDVRLETSEAVSRREEPVSKQDRLMRGIAGWLRAERRRVTERRLDGVIRLAGARIIGGGGATEADDASERKQNAKAQEARVRGSRGYTVGPRRAGPRVPDRLTEHAR